MTITVPAWPLVAHALLPIAACTAEFIWEGKEIPFTTDQAIRFIFYSFAAGATISLGIGALTPSFHRYCSFLPPTLREVTIGISYVGASIIGIKIFFDGKDNPINEIFNS